MNYHVNSAMCYYYMNNIWKKNVEICIKESCENITFETRNSTLKIFYEMVNKKPRIRKKKIEV